MSDREIIIQLLRTVEWRIRANRLLNELVLGLSVVVAALIILKVWDLITPLQALTIEGIFGVCLALFVGFAIWRIRQKGTLVDAAEVIDRKAGLQDEIKTAFWFINNPRSSDWVSRQIQRAARSAREAELDVGSLAVFGAL